MPLPDPRASGGPLADLARVSGLGLSFAATLLLFAGAGWWVDRKLGSSPLFLLLAVFLGFGLSLYSILRKLPSGKRGGATHPPPGCDDDPRSKKPR
jgi:F0F1-type ATP synthase assembly protein I